MPASRALTIALFVGLVALALFPLFGDKYYIQLLTKIMIMAIFAMSLDLLVGYTGLVSLGHAAFFGLAGYVLAMMAPQDAAASLWITLPAALGGAALAALIIGFLVLRTSGIYFIMVTLAFAQMLFFFIHDSKYFGGSDGAYVYFRPTAALTGVQLFDLENFNHFYYVVLALMAGVYVLLQVILRSPFGAVIVGIRTNEHRMRSLGYPTFRYKLVCFVIGGTVAGLAGYFNAAQFGFVNPELLSWHQSGIALMMVLLGGMGTLFGPVLGAFAMILLEQLFQGLTEHWLLVMGGFIIAVVLFLPHGLYGLAAQLGRKREAEND
ncbi:MAG: branched-chain amino acid ABC transporter permease [Rhodocyclales bacterium]|nr:branched-chain amino acid ABC transporter permease [Rhodocyclales bacterium]